MITRLEAIRELTAPGQPYALVEQVCNGRRCRVFVNAPATLRVLFEEAVSPLPFIVYGEERLTFEAYWQAASALGAMLVERHAVGPGDRVAISMRNYPEWMVAFAAITSIGAVAVAMNALWQPDEMAYGLADSGARVLIADGERLDRLAGCESIPDGLVVLATRCAGRALPDGASDLGHAVAAFSGRAMPGPAPAPDDDATILYTSGSTGHPKGAVSSHRNIVHALLSWELEGRIGARITGVEPPEPTAQPATLLAVPLFHVTGCHAVFLSSLRAQRRLVSMYKWDVAEAMELVERERITTIVAPAAMTGDLVAAAADSDRDLSSLAVVGGGGAPRAPEQVRGIDRAFANAVPNTGWGMTETNAIGTGISGPDYLEHPATSGRVSAVLDIRVVDESGAALPAGARGELQVRGTSVIRGYWNRPDADAEAFDGDWFRTGDVAVIDDEGYLTIVDRIKDLVIRGGENIGCGTVEAALLEHPDVLEACVYGVPDARLGEEVGATVHVRRPVDADALRSFLAARLARFEVPRYIRFEDAPLPRTASGKILKREIREAARALHAGGAGPRTA